MISIREKDTSINSLEINKILSIRYHFDRGKKDTCVNSSGMKVMFDIPCDFKLSVKFSAHMTNCTRAKMRFSCTNYFSCAIIYAHCDQFSSGDLGQL